MMALEGIRVLDLCIVLAGPTCGRTLAEYGAEVIKIDSPTRPASDSMWIDVSRGKRSMILDLSKPEGKAVFYRLLATADVVVQNFRKDVADRLGVGYEAVQAAKPDIIYASINAFGYEGPWATRPGFEQNGQAATGIQAREGGPDGPPSLAPFPVNDYGTGIMAAYAVMLALYERSRTGHGQHVDAALAYTGSLLQSPFLIDFAGHQRQDIGGPAARGFSALSRLYQAQDGWLFLEASHHDAWDRLLTLPQFASLAGDSRFASRNLRREHDADLIDGLARIFAEDTVEQWLARLNRAGVPAVRNAALREFYDDPALREAGFVVTREHEALGTVDQVGVPARLSRTPPRMGHPSQPAGAETETILREIGYTAQQIAGLRQLGAIPRS